ncbi:MAG: gephyrin-like molybdotransferase Glp [Myxococcota bacterium]
MISYNEAIDIVINNTDFSVKEYALIEDTINRYLAEDIISPVNLPMFDNSAMDGYAINYLDTINATLNQPVRLKIVGEVRTGERYSRSLQRGEAIVISTGSKIPSGANAVVMKEEVDVKDNYLLVYRAVKKGENIRFRGEEIKEGRKILKMGERITPAIIGLLAQCGLRRIKVFKKPKIGFVSSGTELLEPGSRLKDFQIYNSNYYSISALLQMNELDVNYYGIVKDNYREIHTLLTRVLKESEVILISGGVSVGNVDYIKDVLKKLGVREYFFRVKMKPGKPVFFGKKRDKLIFGLPGNPVSSFVSSFLFVLPALRKMLGSKEPYHRSFEAMVAKEFIKKGDRPEFLRGIYRCDGGKLIVEPVVNQGSHMMSGLSAANCLIITEEGEQTYKRGECVRIYPLW